MEEKGVRTGDIVLMDEVTASSEPQEGDLVRIEGYELFELDAYANPPYMILRKM